MNLKLDCLGNNMHAEILQPYLGVILMKLSNDRHREPYEIAKTIKIVHFDDYKGSKKIFFLPNTFTYYSGYHDYICLDLIGSECIEFEPTKREMTDAWCLANRESKKHFRFVSGT